MELDQWTSPRPASEMPLRLSLSRDPLEDEPAELVVYCPAC
jgi:hypothetical protein